MNVDTDTVIEIANVITAAVTAAAIITAATKNPRDDVYANKAAQWWKRARRVLNVLGFNVKHARNLEDE